MSPCKIQLLWDTSVLSVTAAPVIASKTQESDYDSVAKNVYQELAEYNKSLVDSLQNNKS